MKPDFVQLILCVLIGMCLGSALDQLARMMYKNWLDGRELFMAIRQSFKSWRRR